MSRGGNRDNFDNVGTANALLFGTTTVPIGSGTLTASNVLTYDGSQLVLSPPTAGATPTLTQVLTAGNTSGASNIVMNAGQSISFVGNVSLPSTLANSNVIIGPSAASTALANGLAVGANANSSATGAACFGANTVASASNAFALGASSTASGTDSLALGNGSTTAGFASSVALGPGATVTAANQIKLGTAAFTTSNLGAMVFSTGLATNNTANLITLPKIAGTPSGAAASGSLAYDSTNNLFYGRTNAAWTAFSTGTPTLSQVLTAGNTTGSNQNIIYTTMIRIGSAGSAPLGGINATAIAIGAGSGNAASQPNSTAVGVSAQTAGAQASSFGQGANAAGLQATAIGCSSTANAASTSLGYLASCTTAGGGSVALGISATDQAGANNVAVGNSAQAGSGGDSTALGRNCQLGTTTQSVGVGSTVTISNGSTGSIAIGYSSSVTGLTSTNSVVLGALATTSSNNTVAVGKSSTVNAATSVAVGDTTTVAAGCTNSTVIGSGASINGTTTNSAVFGSNSSAATGANSTVLLGSGIVAGSFANCVAVGAGTTTTAANSIVIGQGQAGPGSGCIAIGRGSTLTTASSNCVYLGNSQSDTRVGGNTGCVLLGNGASIVNGSVSARCTALQANAAIEAGQSDFLYTNTTFPTLTSAAGVAISVDAATGRIHANSSSIRYKQDVKPIRDPERILRISGADYAMKNSEKWGMSCGCPKLIVDPVTGEDIPNPCDGMHSRDVGLIAELVANEGLEEFVVYAPDRDNPGKQLCQSVKYDRLVAPIIDVLKLQRNRIETLEADNRVLIDELTKHEDRLAKLEALVASLVPAQ